MEFRSACLRSTLFGVVVIALVSLTVAPSRAQSCPGDCNGDGIVTVTELAVGTRALLERLASVSDCPASDLNGDAAVTVEETVAATFAFLNGCGSSQSAPLGAPAGTANPIIEVSTATGTPASQVVVSATLHTMGHSIAGTQQDIAFDPLTPITSCHRNPAINKGATAFGFQPSGCTKGVDCTAVRALVFSFSNIDPIPDGSVLFTCDIDISPAAPGGVYPLRNSNVLGSTPEGEAVATDAIDGSVIVELAPTPMPTMTLTPTPRPAPASLVLEKVRLKADTATKPGRDNGSLSARGIVNANAPFANFVADMLTTGLAVRLTGAGGVDLTLLWQAGDCSRRDTSRGPRIKCKAEDASGKRKARFRPTRSPNVFRASISSRGLDFPPPLAADPVTMVLTTTSFERQDVIGGCRVRNQGRIVRCKESGFVPTFTPTATATSTPTHTPTATSTATPPDGTTIIVGNAVGVPGGTAQFIVGLETNADVAGTENEIQFAPSAPLAFTDCQVDPGLDKSLYFTFFPTGCVPDTDCTAMKGLVLSFVNLDPIPNGSTMYSCEIAIFPEALPGNYLIDCFNPGASDPFGNAIATECSNGNMSVLNGSG